MSNTPTEVTFKVAAGRARFTVTFYLSEHCLNADCDCPEGEHGNFCQHRLKLLRGDSSDVVSGNSAELQKVVKSLPGTRLVVALDEFDASASRIPRLRERGPSTELDKVELDFKAARKKLSAMMMALTLEPSQALSAVLRFPNFLICFYWRYREALLRRQSQLMANGYGQGQLTSNLHA